MLPQAKMADQQLQLQIQQRNATADWLQQIGHPELAAPVRSGAITGADAMQRVYAPPLVVHPGDTVLPNTFGMTANGNAPSGSPGGPATGQAGQGALYTAPANNADQMTPQQRAELAPQYGIQKGTPAYANFVLTGKIPDQSAPAGYTYGPPGQDGKPTLAPIPGGPADLGASSMGNAVAPVTFGADGNPDPQQQTEFLKTLDPGVASLVKGIADYQIDPTKVTSLRGNQRQQMMQLVQQYDPSFDMTQYGARSAMRKSITSGTYSQALNSANLVIQHLDALDKAVDDLHNQGGILTPWNKLANATKGATGNPSITNFNTIADAAASELAKVFKGTGVSDVQSIQEWRSNLDPSSSPEQLHQAIHTAIADLLKSRIDTIQNQYQSAMGKPSNFNYLTPHSRETLRSMGIDPSSIDPNAPESSGDASQGQQQYQEGQTATNPKTGERLVFKGGQWVPLNGQ